MKDFNVNDIASQEGRVVIITGSNTGLGFETARALAAKDALVIMAVRDIEKGNIAREKILKDYPGALIDIMPVDLSSLSSVKEFAKVFLALYNRLDLLINNAGIMIPPYSKTCDGFASNWSMSNLSKLAFFIMPLSAIL